MILRERESTIKSMNIMLNKQQNNKRNRQQGFTIVELLIVIVVIAILAAISIVAYNGIQTRTNNTATTQGVAQFIKAYGLYATDNGVFPNATGCLGEGYPADRCLAQDSTGFCFSVGGAISTAVNDALKPYMNSKLPTVSQQKISCGATTYIGAYGAYMDPKNVAIFMMLKGDQSCPVMSPNVSSTVKQYSGDLTYCRYTLTVS